MATFSILDKFPHFLNRLLNGNVTEICWPLRLSSGQHRSVSRGTRPCCSVDADVSNFAPYLAQRQLGKSIGEWLNGHSGTVRCDGSDGERSGPANSISLDGGRSLRRSASP